MNRYQFEAKLQSNRHTPAAAQASDHTLPPQQSPAHGNRAEPELSKQHPSEKAR